jgi:hypothetical protein
MLEPSRRGTPLRWSAGLVLGALLAAGCASNTQTASAAPAVGRPKSAFVQSLSLAMSLGPTAAGDKSMTAKFALTNQGAAVFEGCFGPSWGVAVIVGGHDAGYLVSVDRPACVEKLTLLPGQTIVWSKTVPLSNVRAGTAKVTGWVKLIDPAACDPRVGCHEVSVATQLMMVAIGER